MSSPSVLLCGGHGKVSMLLTPLLLSKSWTVTSLIRDNGQTKDILATGDNRPGKLNVLVRSLEDVKAETDAQKIIDETKPDYVVWSAGAGGKGGPSRTFAIDRDCCIYFARAAANTPSISKFLLVSYLGSRRSKASWWSEEEWKATQEINAGALKNYYHAKLAADECLTAIARSGRKTMQSIILRPGSLTDDEGSSKISLGKTRARGKVRRANVAKVAAELLETQANGWLDLLEGDEEIEAAVQRVEKEGVDCVEGEDVEAMMKEHAG